MKKIKFYAGRMFLGVIKIIDSILVLTSFCLVHSNISNKVDSYLLDMNGNGLPLLYFNSFPYQVFCEFVESLLQIIDGIVMIVSFGHLNFSLKYKFMMYTLFRD